MAEQKRYLTIHGHFYQPPRENPWLETVEKQDSASPFHDWNERINFECYNPNSVSRIVDKNNEILDIVNNYEYMSFNFGPTLLSWMEQNAPHTYERIIQADLDSKELYSGHGNALAQVYNHIIMPLANERDKYTQIIWGIKDFKYRYGRLPEGMWLAETAADDATMRALADCGIKFTVLSPFQAKKFRTFGDKEFTDVSWGNIDPARPYRYFIKDSDKYIDIFFYDGAISKSVAFDNLLQNGEKFAKRLLDGISDVRDHAQLVNIATDGESYGHHTKFGDMALSYVLKVKAKDEGFEITNYAEFLEKFPPRHEVVIKDVSSWSCAHGVGRWREDCGCSTGAGANWNQKWRTPLREALDYLRDELVKIYETEGTKYFRDIYDARNNYIDVILDRSTMGIKKFFSTYGVDNLDYEQKVNALKLLEMQRQQQLMYTSCGWFFADISGIETVQIMKYAAKAMEIASDFSLANFEDKFLEILSSAKSNIPDMGNGREIYEKFVRPSIITVKQIVSLWAVASLYEDFETETNIYSYDIKKLSYRKVSSGTNNLVFGRIEATSRITLEKTDLIFALLQFPDGDFHCAIKEFGSVNEFNKIQKELTKIYMKEPLTEIIRALDEYFGRDYYTMQDIFIEKRRKILSWIMEERLIKFASTYREIYEEGKMTVLHMQNLGLSAPEGYKLAVGYTLSSEFNKLMAGNEVYLEDDILSKARDINAEAKLFGVKLNKDVTNAFYGKKLIQGILKLSYNLEIHQSIVVLELFEMIEKFELEVEITEAQNIYFNKIYKSMGVIIEHVQDNEMGPDGVKFADNILKIGEKLNINIDFYRAILHKTTV